MPSYNNKRGKALLRKTGRIYENFRGDHMDDILDPMFRPTCRICGQLMTPYEDYFNAIIWKCDMPNCPNNPDSKLKFDLNAEIINGIGNLERRWAPFIPRRL